VEGAMLKIFGYFFNKEAVVAELRNGDLPAKRAKDFLVFWITFLLVWQLFSICLQVFQNKPGLDTPLAKAGAFLSAFLLFGLAYVIARLMLESLYHANGGEAGKRFYERLFVLGMSAGMRVLIFLVPAAILGLVLISFFAAYFTNEALFLGVLALFALAVVILPLVWIFRDVRSGLKALSEGS
jgi:hypothetical protein